MKNNRFTVFSALLVFSALSHAQVTNHEAQGNLQSTHAIGCISPDKVRNTYTPADLYKGVGACIESGNVENGTFLLITARLYGNYDSDRVSDPTARGAGSMLQMAELSAHSEDKVALFNTGYQVNLKDKKNLALLCKNLKKLGPPNYYPTYMIQHGMGAFTGKYKDNPLVADFDSKASWQPLLDDNLGCKEIK